MNSRVRVLRFLVVIAVAFVAVVLPPVPFFRSVELLVRDRLLALAPARPARLTAAVLVDEEALRAFGPWPWTRERLAGVVDAIGASGARGVVLDVLLPEAREGDAALAAALARRPAILGAALTRDARWLLPAAPLLASARPAHVSFELGGDGVVRGFASTKQAEGRSLPALSFAAAALVRPPLAVPAGRLLVPGFRVRPESVPSSSVAGPLAGLTGRVVFFGASAAGIGDRVVLPGARGGSPTPGVLVHAAAAEAILAGDLIRSVPPPLAALATGFLAWVALAVRRSERRGALAWALLVALMPLPLAAALLLRWDRALPAVSMTLTGVAALGGAELFASRAARRRAALQRARIAELEALARALEDGRRDDAEARRVVAHELKTPLTSVRGFAQLLGTFDLDEPERKRVAAMVVSETSRLSEMVEALLDLERLKLKDYDKAARRVDFSRVVGERVALLRGTGRAIAADVAPGIAVVGDEPLLSRVLDNLAGNALKFSPDGAPVAVRLSAAGAEALLEVEDRGPGVPAEERESIFRRFDRGGAAPSAPGLGLGLALVAEVVAWHGGRVSVADAPGGGSVFLVRLPLADRQ